MARREDRSASPPDGRSGCSAGAGLRCAPLLRPGNHNAVVRRCTSSDCSQAARFACKGKCCKSLDTLAQVLRPPSGRRLSRSFDGGKKSQVPKVGNKNRGAVNLNEVALAKTGEAARDGFTRGADEFADLFVSQGHADSDSIGSRLASRLRPMQQQASQPARDGAIQPEQPDRAARDVVLSHHFAEEKLIESGANGKEDVEFFDRNLGHNGRINRVSGDEMGMAGDDRRQVEQLPGPATATDSLRPELELTLTFTWPSTTR